MRDYEILHLKPGASPAQIRRAYLDLVRVWHPDRFTGDPRLQKIAHEKLSEINEAYLTLEKEKATEDLSRPAYPSAPEASRERPPPSAFQAQTLYHWPAWPHSQRWLWLSFAVVVFVLGAMRVYAFFLVPMSALESITADARRIAAWNGPSPVDAFAGWNGVLPQGLDRLEELYLSNSAAGHRDLVVSRLRVRAASPRKRPAIAPPPAFLPGVGEIQVYNHTTEEIILNLKAARARSAIGRGTPGPAQADVVFGNLGPDIYMIDVSFPRSQRPPMRLGPFVMVVIETPKERRGDRYEITLGP